LQLLKDGGPVTRNKQTNHSVCPVPVCWPNPPASLRRVQQWMIECMHSFTNSLRLVPFPGPGVCPCLWRWLHHDELPVGFTETKSQLLVLVLEETISRQEILSLSALAFGALAVACLHGNTSSSVAAPPVVVSFCPWVCFLTFLLSITGRCEPPRG